MFNYKIKNGTSIILSIMLMFLITSCSSVNSYQKSIYYDDSKISKQGDSYSFISRVGNTDKNKLSITFHGFNGKETIWIVDAKKDGIITIDLQTEINSGEFKVCLINVNNEVTIIPNNKQKELTVLNVLKGKNYIAIVGSNSKGKIDMVITANENVQLQTTNN